MGVLGGIVASKIGIKVLTEADFNESTKQFRGKVDSQCDGYMLGTQGGEPHVWVAKEYGTPQELRMWKVCFRCHILDTLEQVITGLAIMSKLHAIHTHTHIESMEYQSTCVRIFIL